MRFVDARASHERVKDVIEKDVSFVDLYVMCRCRRNGPHRCDVHQHRRGHCTSAMALGRDYRKSDGDVVGTDGGGTTGTR